VVPLARDNALDVQSTDDGVGVPRGGRPGVGLTSMRERAAELGGTWEIERAAGRGTRIHARLPLHQEAA
jgi:signal transduction histidine kinase